MTKKKYYMFREIIETEKQSELYASILRHLKISLSDKYVLLESSIDFNDFLYPEKLSSTKIDNDKIKLIISNILKNRKEDYNEFSIYQNLISNLVANHEVENKVFLLIIEIENYQKIKPAYENYVKSKPKLKEKKKESEDKVMFHSSKPKFSLDQIILSDEERGEIKNSLTLLQRQDLIYDVWGFGEIDSKPRLILNFYGLPGTGKTMTAHALANQLDIDILLINYSDIESKYVGDAPKNLVQAFEEAKKTKALLFFDEADSFLGKRVENVTSSSDQSVNSLRSQMLIELENFEGVVIFATNLVKNYDAAFESRILKHIEFKLPSKENRIKILDLMLLPTIPYKENFNRKETLDKIAEITKGYSGRELKNAVLETLTFGASEGDKDFLFSSETFITIFERSKNKKDQLEKSKKGKGIPDEIKKKISEKIKANLNVTKN